jgi:hypothetical protein
METPITLQDQLFEAIKAIYSDAIPKKINTDNYLDVKIPSVITKKSAHLYFNSSKEKIKVGVLFIDAEMIEALIAKNDSLEKFSNGVRLVSNPTFSNIQDAINAAKKLLDCISSITNNEQNNPTTQNQIINDTKIVLDIFSEKMIEYSGLYRKDASEIYKINVIDNKLIGRGISGKINAILVDKDEHIFEGNQEFHGSTQKIRMKFNINYQRFECLFFMGTDIKQIKIVTDFDRIEDIEKVLNFDDDSVYFGDIENGKSNGNGQMFYSNGDVYDGKFSDGQKCGKGVMNYFSGDFYIGDWLIDEPMGKGNMKFKNGEIYDGEILGINPLTGAIWKNGKGKRIYSNGDIYEGEWKLDIREGKGKLTFKNGDVQEGEFKNDKFVENKINVNKDDNVVVEKFKVISYQSSDKYEGETKDGKRHGKGKYTWVDGNVYEGDFLDGKRTGKGKYTWTDGGVYVGDFVNGDFNGKGKKTYSNGNIYEGDWKDGKRHGNGKMIYSKGDIYDGKWVGGDRIGKTILEQKSDIEEKEIIARIAKNEAERLQRKEQEEKAKLKKPRTFSINYKIKLKEVQKGFFFDTPKGALVSKTISFRHDSGVLTESQAKLYIMTNDKDILSGKAGSTNIFIQKIY